MIKVVEDVLARIPRTSISRTQALERRSPTCFRRFLPPEARRRLSGPAVVDAACGDQNGTTHPAWTTTRRFPRPAATSGLRRLPSSSRTAASWGTSMSRSSFCPGSTRRARASGEVRGDGAAPPHEGCTFHHDPGSPPGPRGCGARGGRTVTSAAAGCTKVKTGWLRSAPIRCTCGSRGGGTSSRDGPRTTAP